MACKSYTLQIYSRYRKYNNKISDYKTILKLQSRPKNDCLTFVRAWYWENTSKNLCYESAFQQFLIHDYGEEPNMRTTHGENSRSCWARQSAAFVTNQVLVHFQSTNMAMITIASCLNNHISKLCKLCPLKPIFVASWIVVSQTQNQSSVDSSYVTSIADTTGTVCS